MADRVTDYATRSLAKFTGEVASMNGGYVVTPDFDWNQKVDPANIGGAKLTRSTPFAGVVLVADGNLPFTVSANILREVMIEVQLWIAAGSSTELKHATADVKQALAGAVNPVTSGVGIPLYDYSTTNTPTSGHIAGTLQIEMFNTEYFGPADYPEEDNRKYRSVTPITMSAFKDSTATLLENKQRINLTDS